MEERFQLQRKNDAQQDEEGVALGPRVYSGLIIESHRDKILVILLRYCSPFKTG